MQDKRKGYGYIPASEKKSATLNPVPVTKKFKKTIVGLCEERKMTEAAVVRGLVLAGIEATGLSERFEQ